MKKLNLYQAGYSILELMVVVVIIGILSALAIPAYIAYTNKSIVADGLSLAGQLKTAVGEHYQTNEVMPANRAALGLGPSTNTQSEYVQSIDVVNGALLITYGNDAQNPSLLGNVVGLYPLLDADQNIAWVCGDPTPPSAGLTPGGVWGAAEATTVPSDILPSNCR